MLANGTSHTCAQWWPTQGGNNLDTAPRQGCPLVDSVAWGPRSGAPRSVSGPRVGGHEWPPCSVRVQGMSASVNEPISGITLDSGITFNNNVKV